MMLWVLLQLVIEFQAHLDMKPSKPLLQGSILSTLEQLAAPVYVHAHTILGGACFNLQGLIENIII